jgi:hypothetical protein
VHLPGLWTQNTTTTTKEVLNMADGLHIEQVQNGYIVKKDTILGDKKEVAKTFDELIHILEDYFEDKR